MATELNVKLNNTLNGTSLKAIQDKNANDITQTYFPKTGGTLNGKLIARNVNDSRLGLCGGMDYNFGAGLFLYGNNYVEEKRANTFELQILDINQDNLFRALIGKIDGTLTWNRNDLSGTAIVANSLGSNGYVKYASGLIVQWGRTSNNFTSAENINILFNINFTSTQYALITSVNAMDTPEHSYNALPIGLFINQKHEGYAWCKCSLGLPERITGIEWLAIGL